MPTGTDRHGQPMTRDGIAYVLAKHAAAAADTNQTLRRKHITPHVLRHSCAVARLQSGTDVTVIRDYLGHASVATITAPACAAGSPESSS